jgi:hypothetical protein
MTRAASPPDPLSHALDEAAAARPAALHALLERGSHLPGTRMNSALAEAFAQACRTRGAAIDEVVLALARLSLDEAPGATAREFLPVCGVFGLGARAAADARVYRRFLDELHGRADDARFRVRDAVVEALGRIGQVAGDKLVSDVSSWMDGYFHAAAVLRALSADRWLGALHNPEGVLDRLGDALGLLRAAPRAAARWPGHKELVATIEQAPAAFALRFGVPVLDWLAAQCVEADATTRGLLERALQAPKLAGRFGPEVARVAAALTAARPPPRNPDHDVGPTRDRSRRRRRR